MDNSKTRDTFIFREQWWRNIKLFPDCRREQVYDALCKYVFEGIAPEFDPMDAVSTAIHFIITDINDDKTKYDEVCAKRSEAGKRGNEVRWHGQSQNVANIANAKSESQKSQKVANVADYDYEYDCEYEGENEKQKDKSFSFSQKKEKIIFDFSLILLSEGRPNAYKEAMDAYDFNESTGWTTETTKQNGDVTKKKITNPLSWLQGWKRSNEQIFAPEDGMLFAEVLRKIMENEEIKFTPCADIINYFRGFRHEGENVSILFTNVKTMKRFSETVNGDKRVQSILYPALQKQFAGAQTLYYKTI